MPTSVLALKLIFILVPGGLATLILQKLTTYLKWEATKFLINSILLGGLSYIIADVLFYYWYSEEIKTFWNSFAANDIPFWDIVRATIVSILLGFFSAWLENKKIITNLARRVNIADKYGEENLYSYFLNRPDVNEVYVRDIPNGLTFHGLIDSFSENDTISEISLIDVKVYNYADSSLLYNMPKVFLARPKNAIFIEVPI